MEAKLRQAFESWPKGPASEAAGYQVHRRQAGLLLRSQKSDVNQSSIAMLDLGIERSNPDYFAVSVMNEIFGGGFSSRLFNDLRAAQGLAYTVGGGVGYGWNRPGLTNIEMQTKSASTVEGIQGSTRKLTIAEESSQRRGAEASQGPHPELLHLPVRYARKSAAREDGVRVLSLPARLSGALSQPGRECHGRRCGRV